MAVIVYSRVQFLLFSILSGINVPTAKLSRVAVEQHKVRLRR